MEDRVIHIYMLSSNLVEKVGFEQFSSLLFFFKKKKTLRHNILGT